MTTITRHGMEDTQDDRDLDALTIAVAGIMERATQMMTSANGRMATCSVFAIVAPENKPLARMAIDLAGGLELPTVIEMLHHQVEQSCPGDEMLQALANLGAKAMLLACEEVLKRTGKVIIGFTMVNEIIDGGDSLYGMWFGWPFKIADDASRNALLLEVARRLEQMIIDDLEEKGNANVH